MSNKVSSIMAHMIPFYPTRQASLDSFKGIIDGGASFLEIQFPFSDPSADGPVIEYACTKALEEGFTVAKGFDFIHEVQDYLRSQKKQIPIFIMVYSSLLITPGIKNFLSRCKEAGVFGIICPDLPFDHDEGLLEEARSLNIEVCPVVAPVTDIDRLKKLGLMGFSYIYAVLRKGITGTKTEFTKDNMAFLEVLGGFDAHVFGGFGIQEREQVKFIEQHLDSPVVGTMIVKRTKSSFDNGPSIIQKEMAKYVGELCGIQ